MHIAYNTTRLSKIISDHNETVEHRARRKAQNKGKGVTELEKKSIIKYYLEGSNVSDIAKALYRSPAFIKAVIERMGVPQKLPDTDYKGIKEAMIPESCVAEEFEVGERVWSAQGNCIAVVKREITKSHNFEKHGSKCYLLWEIEMAECESPYFGFMKDAGYNAPRLAYNIGSLKHLQEYL